MRLGFVLTPADKAVLAVLLAVFLVVLRIVIGFFRTKPRRKGDERRSS